MKKTVVILLLIALIFLLASPVLAKEYRPRSSKHRGRSYSRSRRYGRPGAYVPGRPYSSRCHPHYGGRRNYGRRHSYRRYRRYRRRYRRSYYNYSYYGSYYNDPGYYCTCRMYSCPYCRARYRLRRPSVVIRLDL